MILPIESVKAIVIPVSIVCHKEGDTTLTVSKGFNKFWHKRNCWSIKAAVQGLGALLLSALSRGRCGVYKEKTINTCTTLQLHFSPIRIQRLGTFPMYSIIVDQHRTINQLYAFVCLLFLGFVFRNRHVWEIVT